ncbi:serine hydrolase domain-containing protein [Amycolatopsis sp. cg5]|uniref:serine hydrolase domain-containing protein n=1 Tax=Amycolatopsis sp. cg5 TaxID=3238802 RepID=UPI0035266E60
MPVDAVEPVGADLSTLAEALDAFVPAVLAATGVPGATVAVVNRTGDSHTAAFGHADLAAGRRMQPDDVLAAGSMSKIYVALAVMTMQQRGLLDIDRPVRDYLPDLRIVNPLGDTPVTAYHLLTHQSGLGTDTFDGGLRPPAPLGDYLARRYDSGHRPEYGGVGALWTSPVGRYRYSTLGYGTLGHLVAFLDPDGLSYADHVAERIIAPMGLDSSAVPAHHTGVIAPPSLAGRMPVGYQQFGRWCVPTPHLYSGLYPAGALITTALDQARLVAAFLDPADSAPVVTPSIAHLMREPHLAAAGPGEPPGLYQGIGLEVHHPESRWGHIGHAGAHPFGWWGDSRAYPALGYGCAVLTNGRDMIRYFNPPERSASDLILDFVRRHVAGEATAERVATHSAVNSARTMGLLMVERVRGLVGDATTLSQEQIADIAAGTRRMPDLAFDSFDPGEFTRGAEQMNGIPATPEAIRALLADPSTAGGTNTLNLLALAWGASRPAFPAPHRYWADRAEENTDMSADSDD